MLYFIWLANQYSLYNIGGFLVAKAIAGLTGIAGGLFSLCYKKTPNADFTAFDAVVIGQYNGYYFSLLV